MTAKTMVDTQVRPRGISDDRVLTALEHVPRDYFVPKHYQRFAYADCPLPLSDGQTISQPFMVAMMTELLALPEHARVLEIGTGSGYQTAILAEIAAQVYTVEILGKLASGARRRLASMGYDHIHFRVGDGHEGWPEAAPYDAIIATAAPVELPEKLVRQLRVGGRLVIPVGDPTGFQRLYCVTKTDARGFDQREVMSVRFVPMVSPTLFL